jgi:hypothetical protein
MGLFLDHVNVCLSKMRADPITVLSSDPTTDAFRAQVAVNRAVRRIWNHAKWTFRRKTYTFSTVAAQTDYILDKSVGQIYSVLSANQPYKLQPISRFNLDKLDPQRTLTGDPRLVAISDISPVIVQTAAASVISVVSNNVLDITQKVLVKGVVGGQVFYEQLALNGTTPALTTNSFTSIISITKSDVTLGQVIVTAGATTLLVLGALEKTAYLRIMTLYPIPTSIILITVRFFGVAYNMTNAYEETGIPDEWDYVVDQWAFILALQAKGQDQTTEFNEQMVFGTKMLDQDMSTEESDSSDDPILIDDAGALTSGREGLWLAPGRGEMQY